MHVPNLRSGSFGTKGQEAHPDSCEKSGTNSAERGRKTRRAHTPVPGAVARFPHCERGRMSKLKTAFLFLLLIPMIVTYDPRRTLPNPVDEIGAAVASASASITGNIRAGKHLGFDTYAYPGDDAMLAWKQDGAPYEWVGYYLPSAPC